MARKSKRKPERDSANMKQIPNRGTRRRWMTAAILAVGIAAGIAAWQWKNTLWGYKDAPSFTLSSSTGQLVSLRDYRGKKEVVLLFYMGAG